LIPPGRETIAESHGAYVSLVKARRGDRCDRWSIRASRCHPSGSSIGDRPRRREYRSRSGREPRIAGSQENEDYGMKNGNRFFEHSSGRCEGGRHDDYRSAAEREARRRGAGRRRRVGPRRRGPRRSIGGHRDTHLGILLQSWRWVTGRRAWSVLSIKAVPWVTLQISRFLFSRNPRLLSLSKFLISHVIKRTFQESSLLL